MVKLLRKPERGSPSTTLPSRKEERYTHHREREYRERRDSYKGREKAEEATPKPVGSMCSPLCPLFRCSKRALFINLINGRSTPYCNWVNDTCIGYKCQYATCVSRYLLPDGKCLTVVRNVSKNEDEFMKELENRKSDASLKSLLSRRGINKDLGIEDF